MFLVRAGLLIVWLSLDVFGFRLVLARGWHGVRTERHGPARRNGEPLLSSLGQYFVDAGLIFGQAGTNGWVGLPLAPGLRLTLVPLSSPGQQSPILGVSVPRRLLDSPDDVLKLISRDLDPDPSVWGGPHLALTPDVTHPTTELPEPGMLAWAVLPQARPTAADGNLQFDKPLAGFVNRADPGDRAGIVAGHVRGVDYGAHSAPSIGPAATAGKLPRTLPIGCLAVALFAGLLSAVTLSPSFFRPIRLSEGEEIGVSVFYVWRAIMHALLTWVSGC